MMNLATPAPNSYAHHRLRPQSDRRVSVVVLTHNRPAELACTLRHLLALPEQPKIIVVDSGSKGRCTIDVLRNFPSVDLVRCPRNLGAAARNAGVSRVRTPYVAFCDDDTWWAAGALRRACDLLDRHARLGAVAARVLVGPEDREDPNCARLAASPLDPCGLPGPALMTFMAGAVLMRVEAFLDAGGYEPRLFLGAEEALLGLDLVSRGWQIVYANRVVTHHHPSPAPQQEQRRVLLARNRLWVAWLRLPPATAWLETRRVLDECGRGAPWWRALAGALLGLPWVLRHRAVVAPRVHQMHLRVCPAVPRHVHLASGRAG